MLTIRAHQLAVLGQGSDRRFISRAARYLGLRYPALVEDLPDDVVHDMVRGVEDLRTSVDTAVHIEKHVRGGTAGFNTPTFVVDAPGGGGKRDVHSYEYYDPDTGISVYAAPSVKPGQLFTYFDPLHQLATHQQRRWADPAEQAAMIEDALAKARGRSR